MITAGHSEYHSIRRGHLHYTVSRSSCQSFSANSIESLSISKLGEPTGKTKYKSLVALPSRAGGNKDDLLLLHQSDVILWQKNDLYLMMASKAI